MSKVKRGTISLSTLQDPDKQPEMIAITPISMMISEPQPIKKTRTRSRRSGDPIAEENNISLSKSKSTSNKSEKRHRSPSPKKTKKKLCTGCMALAVRASDCLLIKSQVATQFWVRSQHLRHNGI